METKMTLIEIVQKFRILPATETQVRAVMRGRGRWLV